MPLNPQQQQEMQELEELDKLEQQFAPKQEPFSASNINAQIEGETGLKNADLAKGFAGSIGNAAGAASALPQGIAKLLGKNIATRTAAGGAVGAGIGALSAPEGERGSAALKGGAMGAGINLAGEGLQALGGAGKAMYRAWKPGTPEANQAKLQELLTGKTVEVAPGDLMGKDPRIDTQFKKNPDFQEQMQYDKPPETFDMPAGDLDQIRRTADSELAARSRDPKFNEKSLQPETEMYRGIGNKARSQLHDVSPEANAEYNNQSASFDDRKNLDKSFDTITSGYPIEGATSLALNSVLPGAKGALRSAFQPNSMKPQQSLLSTSLHPRSGQDER